MLVNIHKQAVAVLLFLAIAFQGFTQILTLEQCIDSAKLLNKNMLISRNNILIGKQKQKEATANLIPKISAAVDYKYFTNLPYQFLPLSTFNPSAPEGQFKEAQFGLPQNMNANLQLAIPLYNPQVYGAIEISKIASELSELQYKKVAEQIFFEISTLYYNAQLLYHQLLFIDSNLTNAERLLKNMQLLNEQLLAKGTDVAKIKLQVAQLNSQHLSVNSKFQQVLDALKFIIGLNEVTSFSIEPNIHVENEKEYTPSSIIAIEISKTQKKILCSELSTLVKSQFLPSLNMIASYGTNGFGYNKKPNDFFKFYPIGFAGLQLSYPLFNGTVTQRKINQKKIELQNNDLQTNLLADQNMMLEKNARQQKIVASKNMTTSAAQISLAKNIYDQSILQQQQGTASLSDVLLADNALRDAQQLYLSAMIDYLKAELEIKQLTGSL